MVLSPSWAGQVTGRLLAGTGGVLLNVLMSKLVADLFAGREIATAMGIFVNSWPVGIAAALLVLPLIGPADDPQPAQIAVALVALAGLGLFLLGTRPAAAAVATGGESAVLRGAALGAVIIAGSIWGLYNAAIGMVFGFGPAMLVERGWSLPAASATTSLALWALALSVPLGGVLADRLGRRDAVMLGSCLLFGALLSVTPGSAQTLLLIALTGLAGGLAAGPIMSLPAAVLVPGNRALGMGVFFTLFYLFIVLAPILAGWLSEHRGTAAAAFHLGTAMLGLCCAALLPYRALARRAGNA
jgi:predicted MFS family arabinose efflux permease